MSLESVFRLLLSIAECGAGPKLSRERPVEATSPQIPATCLTFASNNRELVGQICENFY